MPRKLTANRSSAREARGLVGQMTCPTSRPPWPARGPLGRLREARQGPGEARTVATIGACPQEDYDLTRVKQIKSNILNCSYHLDQLTALDPGPSTLTYGKNIDRVHKVYTNPRILNYALFLFRFR